MYTFGNTLKLVFFQNNWFLSQWKEKQLCPSFARKATVHVSVYLEQTFVRGCSSSVQANKPRNLIAVVTYRLVPHPLLNSDRILNFVIRIYDCHFPKILQQTPGNQKIFCSCTSQQSPWCWMRNTLNCTCRPVGGNLPPDNHSLTQTVITIRLVKVCK